MRDQRFYRIDRADGGTEDTGRPAEDDRSPAELEGNRPRMTETQPSKAGTQPSTAGSHAATKPLSGLRVIELSSFVASPLGGMTLAQLGADVIRVDPVGGGPDRYRWPLSPEGESLYWAGLNKGKRSVTVDLRSEEGRSLVADLIESSGPSGGIVLTNAPERPLLGPEELRARRPDLIHAQLLGRSDGGTAVDYTVNASTGFPMLTGPPEHRGPVNHALPVWDIVCGLYLSNALLAAERQRLLHGGGQQLRISLQDVALATAGNLGFLGEAQFGGQRPRIGNHLYGGFGRDFETADHRHVMVLALTPRHWQDLVRVTGTREVVDGLERAMGVDFKHDADRYRHRDVLAALFAPWFAARTHAEVERELADTSVLWSPYRTFAEVADDSATAEHPMMSYVDEKGVGTYLAPGAPASFEGQWWSAEPAPTIGAQTDDVLGEFLGLSREALADLRNRRIAGETDR